MFQNIEIETKVEEFETANAHFEWNVSDGEGKLRS